MAAQQQNIKQTEMVQELEEDQVEEHIIRNIEELQNQGINMGDLNKLKACGFATVKSLIMATKKELTNVKGMSQAQIEQILECAVQLEQATFINGNMVLNKRKNMIQITTGSKQLDKLLGGGIESLSITQVYGEFRTGQTQLCHTLCVTAQMDREQGGGAGKVLYIDTEGTFRPERISPIAERFGLDAETVLGNISYARAYTAEHQNQLIIQSAALMVGQEERYSLIIVDSIMALFRVDFSGRGELSQRQQHLGQMLSKLIQLAEQFNIAVFMTNQVMSDPGATMSFVADPQQPIGGNILAHASTTRIGLRKGKGENRIAQIADSPCLPESECTFSIGDAGIGDEQE